MINGSGILDFQGQSLCHRSGLQPSDIVKKLTSGLSDTDGRYGPHRRINATGMAQVTMFTLRVCWMMTSSVRGMVAD